MIALSTVLFLLTAAVLYYKWATTNEPNCVIVISAAPSLEGAIISVDNIMFTQPLKMTIGAYGRYAIPFYVDPGDYDVTVTLGGELQHQARVTVNNVARGQMLDLTKLRPTTNPIPTTARAT